MISPRTYQTIVSTLEKRAFKISRGIKAEKNLDPLADVSRQIKGLEMVNTALAEIIAAYDGWVPKEHRD